MLLYQCLLIRKQDLTKQVSCNKIKFVIDINRKYFIY